MTGPVAAEPYGERHVPPGLSRRLIRSLPHRPVWFGGVACVIAGFLLQAAALGNGRMSVVESLLVLDLPVALMPASLLLHSPMRPREWAASAAMAAGLLLIAAGVWWARLTGRGARKAAILGTTTSCGFGLTAALIKGMTATFARGLAALLTSWQLYAMVVAGAGSMFLLQSAVHAGRLLAAQPGLSLGDPVISILWGTLVFDEEVRGGPSSCWPTRRCRRTVPGGRPRRSRITDEAQESGRGPRRAGGARLATRAPRPARRPRAASGRRRGRAYGIPATRGTARRPYRACSEPAARPAPGRTVYRRSVGGSGALRRPAGPSGRPDGHDADPPGRRVPTAGRRPSCMPQGPGTRRACRKDQEPAAPRPPLSAPPHATGHRRPGRGTTSCAVSSV
ncbi:hypothetical protein [Streptomyces sp. NPDC004658]|uniref:hypothetical protein n=1 Tax=Streptomyces sp. NPDC004658 TaxID=3154672 RepID=UPI0033ABAA85